MTITPQPMAYTLSALVTRAARMFGTRKAITDGDTRLNWVEVDAQRRIVARALIGHGIKKGDRVAIQAPNIYEYVIAAMGILTLGAILVPLNTRFKGHESGDILRRSGARILFTVTGFLDTDFPGMLAGEVLPDLERIVLLRGESAGLTNWSQFKAEADAVSDDKVDAYAALVQPDDIADLMFTSGTTGKPKGALHTHRQDISCYETASGIYGLTADDNFLIVPPFFHSFGYKSGWLVSVIRGAHMMPALTFDIDRMLPQIEQERISVLPGPPTVFHSLMVHPRRKDYDLTSLRLAIIGASTIPVELVRKTYSELKFRSVLVGYGLTENTALVTITRSEDDPIKVATTAGKPLPGILVKIIDGEGKELPQGEAGEIIVNGPYVMKGYYNDPVATAQTIDKDGWLHTGDIGLFDEDGYLKVTDRIKDMYIVGGFNCYPAEIENLLMQMPGVQQAAVIGVPDERMGEVGKAFIIRSPGSTITDTEVIAWARDNMANFKAPRFVEFVDAYPLNASGKVLKTELRAKDKARAG